MILEHWGDVALAIIAALLLPPVIAHALEIHNHNRKNRRR